MGLGFFVIMLIGLSGLVFNTPKALASTSNVVDISWPNCQLKSSDDLKFAIIGLNGGLVFTHNRCLETETRLFLNNYSVYLNTGYPGINSSLKFMNYPLKCQSFNNTCIAFNYGYNAAQYSINYANSTNTHSFSWWLDVETDNSWTKSIYINRSVLEGMVKAIKQTVRPVLVGFYSYPAQWHKIVGHWHNYLPEWVASGSSSLKTAIGYCSQGFNGGPVILSQYTTNLDYDYSCSQNNIFQIKINGL